MSLAFFVGWLQRPPAFLRLLHYFKQLPRLGFPSVVTLSALKRSLRQKRKRAAMNNDYMMQILKCFFQA